MIPYPIRRRRGSIKVALGVEREGRKKLERQGLKNDWDVRKGKEGKVGHFFEGKKKKKRGAAFVG